MDTQGKKIQCIGDWVYLIPSASPNRGLLFIPETVAEHTAMCKVASRGKNVSHFIQANDVVMCENFFSDRQNLTLANGFFCESRKVFAVIKNKLIYPIGRKLLIRRDMEETRELGIVIPENRRFQSLFGTVIRWGLFRGTPNLPIGPGDKIRLKKWEASMVEVQLPDGGYGLIVDEKDLLYKIEE